MSIPVEPIVSVGPVVLPIKNTSAPNGGGSNDFVFAGSVSVSEQFYINFGFGLFYISTLGLVGGNNNINTIGLYNVLGGLDPNTNGNPTRLDGFPVLTIINGDNDANNLSGGTFSDDIYGGGGDDILSGNAGNDYLSGGNGDDDLYGGAGNDELDGGNGADYIEGGDGDDDILGGNGSDLIGGGNGDDEIDGGAAADTIYGDAGDDVLLGGDGNDVVYGGAGHDDLYGGAGNDDLFGDAGEDFIYGSDGNDDIFGGGGSDTINGGTGNDIMAGGGGSDVFVFTATNTNHPTSTAPASSFTGNDRINAFSIVQGDQIDLRHLDELDYINLTQIGQNMLMEFIDGNGTTSTSNDREIGQVLITGPGIVNVLKNSANYGTGDDSTIIADKGVVVLNVPSADDFIIA